MVDEKQVEKDDRERDKRINDRDGEMLPEDFVDLTNEEEERQQQRPPQ